MDGFDQRTRTIVVAATNRPGRPRPALLRLAGSTARSPSIGPTGGGGPRSSRSTRRACLRSTSGAEVSKAWPASRRRLFRRGPRQLKSTRGRHPLRAAQTRRSSACPESPAARSGSSRARSASRVISDAEKAIIAYHEGGRAVVQLILPKCAPRLARSRSSAAAWPRLHVMALPQSDRYLQSKTEFEDKDQAICRGTRRRERPARRHDDRRQQQRHREGDRPSPGGWSPSSG